jgi:serine/threonine protein phosphatase PrpC
MDDIDENDFDYQIKFWIEDKLYIYIQNPKNIFESSRIYLAYPYIFRNSIFESYFYKKDKQKITLNEYINKEPLSVIDTCLSESNSDKYHQLFKNYFLVWDIYDIEDCIDNIVRKYKDEIDISIRYYNSVDRKIKFLYKIILQKGGIISYVRPKIIPSIGADGLIEKFIVNTPNKIIKKEIYQKTIELRDTPTIINLSGINFLKSSGVIGNYILNSKSGNIKLTEYHTIGEREYMEDESLICSFGNKDIYMIAVLDGHGGDFASKHFCIDIPKKINKYIQEGKEITEEIIKNAFIKSDRNTWYTQSFTDKGSMGTCFSGVLITDDKIFVINLGDSRTVILNKESKVLFQTEDHKPDNPEEKTRIEKYGSYVTEGRVSGILSLSRALGDFDQKRNDSNKYVYIVSPVPDVKILKREKGMHIIIHCDGLNETLNERYIIDMYNKYNNSVENISKFLCEAAARSRSEDNLSSITLHLE